MSMSRISAVATILISLTAGRAYGDWLYWIESDFQEVQRVRLDGSGFEQVLDQQDLVNRPHTIAFDEINNKMYITDGNRMQRADPDGSNFETLFITVTPPSSPTFNGLFLDVPRGKMYWCSRVPSVPNSGKIQRSNLDGSNMEDLTTDLNFPNYIAFDATADKMYWTDYTGGKIQRADLDGAGLEDLVTGVGNLHGIALDFVAGKMYWADEENQLILRAGLEIPDGETPATRTDIETIVADAGSPQGIALDIDRGHLYWVDLTAFNELILRADMNGGNEVVITTPEDGLPQGITLMLDSTQAIPTASAWGVTVMLLVLLTGGTILWGRCRHA